MVGIRVNGNNVPVSYMEYVYDLQDYFYYISVNLLTRLALYQKVTLVTESTQDFYVIESQFEQSSYRVKLVSEAQFRALSMTTQPYQGNCTVSNLLSSIGAPSYGKSKDSSPSWWMVPAMSVKNVIGTLNKYAVMANGGAPRFYLDYAGKIQCIDLVVQNATKEEVIEGKVIDDNAAIDWLFRIPGSVKFISSSINGNNGKEVVFDNKSLSSFIAHVDSTGNYQKISEQAYKNEFMWCKYTARKINLSDVRTAGHYPGQCVNYRGVKGIVLAVHQSISLNKEPNVNSVVIACQESLGQK